MSLDGGHFNKLKQCNKISVDNSTNKSEEDATRLFVICVLRVKNHSKFKLGRSCLVLLA